MNITASLRKTLATAALAATGFGLLAPVASALPSPNSFRLATESVHINAGNADFGKGGHFAGMPTDSGKVVFSLQTSNTGRDEVRASVAGKVYWDSLTATGCAKVRVQYLSASNNLIASDESDPVCRVGGFDIGQGVPTENVFESASDPAIRKVRISTRKAAHPNGTFEHVSGSRRTVSLGNAMNSRDIPVGTSDRNFSVPGASVESTTTHMVDIRTAPSADLARARVSADLDYTKWANGCAKLRAEFRDEHNNVLQTREREVCKNGLFDDASRSVTLTSSRYANLDDVRLTLTSRSGGVTSSSSRVISLD